MRTKAFTGRRYMRSEGTLERIPLSAPHIDGNEWKYTKECLDTGWVSSVGSFVTRFEDELRKEVDAGHAVATINGTAALHVALAALGIGPDDEVLVPTLTFIAPANAVRYLGAWPLFVDVNPETWQLDVGLIARSVGTVFEWDGRHLRSKGSGRRVAAVVVVHALGHPVNMEEVLDLASRYNLRVVEDATEALGARYRGEPVGALGDIGCFSFNGNKVITTGGGGMIVTNDDDLAQRSRYLSTQAKDDPVEYVHGAVGFNYRLSNVSAAIGCAQMESLGDRIEKKRRIAEVYREAVSTLEGVAFMPAADWAEPIYWLSTIRIVGSNLDSRELIRRLDGDRIEARPLWQPLHLSPAHRGGAGAIGGEVAERIHAEAVSLPSSVGLTDEQQARVIDSLERLLS